MKQHSILTSYETYFSYDFFELFVCMSLCVYILIAT
jgi:hypothetical protein